MCGHHLPSWQPKFHNSEVFLDVLRKFLWQLSAITDVQRRYLKVCVGGGSSRQQIRDANCLSCCQNSGVRDQIYSFRSSFFSTLEPSLRCRSHKRCVGIHLACCMETKSKKIIWVVCSDKSVCGNCLDTAVKLGIQHAKNRPNPSPVYSRVSSIIDNIFPGKYR